MLSLYSLVLFYFQQTNSQLLYVGLQGRTHQYLKNPNPLNPKYRVHPLLWLPTLVVQMLRSMRCCQTFMHSLIHSITHYALIH